MTLFFSYKATRLSIDIAIKLSIRDYRFTTIPVSFHKCLFKHYSQSLQSQMTEFEANAEPLQVWLNSTEVKVQESSARLHDLSAKKQELSKLQVL